MAPVLRRVFGRQLALADWVVVRADPRDRQALADLSEDDWRIVERVSPFTMTSLARRASLLARWTMSCDMAFPATSSSAASGEVAA